MNLHRRTWLGLIGLVVASSLLDAWLFSSSPMQRVAEQLLANQREEMARRTKVDELAERWAAITTQLQANVRRIDEEEAVLRKEGERTRAQVAAIQALMKRLHEQHP